MTNVQIPVTIKFSNEALEKMFKKFADEVRELTSSPSFQKEFIRLRRRERFLRRYRRRGERMKLGTRKRECVMCEMEIV